MGVDPKKLSEVLVQSELLTAEQIKEAEKRALETSKPLQKVLVDDEYLSDENLGQIIADLHDAPFISLKKKGVNEDVMRIIPEIVAKRMRAIAFDRDKDGIKLAMEDPGNEEFVQYVARKTGDYVHPYYGTPRDINDALRRYRRGIKEEFDSIITQSIEATGIEEAEEQDPSITRIVDTILEYAYENKASDVHIEPHDERVAVRFRIDGILHDVVFIPKKLLDSVVTRIKIQSNLRTDEHRAAQDGRLEFKMDDAQVDVRVSIVPVSEGEKVVLRILSEKSRQFKLADLGLEGEDYERVERGYKKPYGMIIVTGPTGSGKTTTLYAVLKLLNKRTVNISTIEDPVEYDVEGVNQIQVNTKTNLTFAKGLRSILRQDPDIIMVGEIRDEETAGIAINAAMTGHLVLTTLHANDASTTLPRLIDMKIEPFMIASTVNVVISQRLVRRIHQGCMESYSPSQEDMEAIARAIGQDRAQELGVSTPGFRLYRGRGCKLCSDTGYEGRVGIFEVLEISEAISQKIMSRANSDEIRQVAIQEGMRSMLDDGIQKSLHGATTIEEVLRATRE